MTLLEIIAALILLLIATIIILNKQKKTSVKKILISEPKTPEGVQQESTLKSVEKPIANVEPAVKPQSHAPAATSVPEPKAANNPVINAEPAIKPQIHQSTASQPKYNSRLPQDSILRRHYLAHVSSMIESLAPLRPTDSVLCRHYDTLLVAKLEQCLINSQEMAQLLEDYENSKPIAGFEPSAQPQTQETAVSNSSCLPQDSILRRHYLTHLCSMIESLAPLRPTDSVLCRHYDTMIVAKLEMCLNNKQAMAQLLSDFEHQQ